MRRKKNLCLALIEEGLHFPGDARMGKGILHHRAEGITAPVAVNDVQLRHAFRQPVDSFKMKKSIDLYLKYIII